MLNASQITKIKTFIKNDEDPLLTIFSVLGDRNRFRIMKLLTEKGEMCVGDLAMVLNITASGASQHLRILEMSGLVTCERMGQRICYKPKTDNPYIKKVIGLMK